MIFIKTLNNQAKGTEEKEGIQYLTSRCCRLRNAEGLQKTEEREGSEGGEGGEASSV